MFYHPIDRRISRSSGPVNVRAEASRVRAPIRENAARPGGRDAGCGVSPDELADGPSALQNGGTAGVTTRVTAVSRRPILSTRLLHQLAGPRSNLVKRD